MIKEYVNDLINWGWTQSELARKWETTQPTVCRWKQRDYETDYKTFKKVEELWKKEKKRQSRRKL